MSLEETLSYEEAVRLSLCKKTIYLEIPNCLQCPYCIFKTIKGLFTPYDSYYCEKLQRVIGTWIVGAIEAGHQYFPLDCPLSLEDKPKTTEDMEMKV